jgi:chromosome segregation ATPase
VSDDFETVYAYISKYGTNEDPEQIDAWAAWDRIKARLREAEERGQTYDAGYEKGWADGLKRGKARVAELEQENERLRAIMSSWQQTAGIMQAEVERLQEFNRQHIAGCPGFEARVTELEQEVERLREALERIAAWGSGTVLATEPRRIAREALGVHAE